jgi:hypothetical protein
MQTKVARTSWAALLSRPVATPTMETINWHTHIPATPTVRGGRQPNLPMVQNAMGVETVLTRWCELYMAKYGMAGVPVARITEILNGSPIPIVSEKVVPK